MSLSRRSWLVGATAGLAGAALPLAVRAVGRASEPASDIPAPAARRLSPDSPDEKTSDVEVLVAPLAIGSLLGPWRVERFVGLDGGAASLVLSDEGGELFQLDVCRRDDAPGALVPPGRSEFFDVYLANGGRGDTASCEHHGLAAMAVADVIRRNEAHCDREGYLTLRERLSTSLSSVKRCA